MSLNREIEAIKKRLAKVGKVANPPKLSVNVYQEDQGEPNIDSPWVLNVMVENKPEPPLIENRPIQEDIKQKH